MSEHPPQFPLAERIGDPSLFVGREKEFQAFDKWLGWIEKRVGPSRALLARKKVGKTAFVERLFNRLWVANGKIIPVFFEVSSKKCSLMRFSEDYFTTILSHVISFWDRNPGPLKDVMTLEDIGRWAETTQQPFVQKEIRNFGIYKNESNAHQAWIQAYSLPSRLAVTLNQRVLVILDEFQNIGFSVYPTEDLSGEPDESMPGSFHAVVESKDAPMLVTGSYLGMIVEISRRYLEAGRLRYIHLSPYLAEHEGLEAVYSYASYFGEEVSNESAVVINQLCQSDPFFIQCVLSSSCPDKDLYTPEGAAEVVRFEIANEDGDFAKTWEEYIQGAVNRVNDIHAKKMLLFLSQQNHQSWTHWEIKEKLNIDLDDSEVLDKLRKLVKADVIQGGSSDIRFRGVNDGTLHMVLRNRFGDEIQEFQADFKSEFAEEIAQLRQENRSLKGKLSHLMGRVAEMILANDIRSRHVFQPSVYFKGLSDNPKLLIQKVETRFMINREDGKTLELDIVAQADEGWVLLVEVKKRETPSDETMVREFLEKLRVYPILHPLAKVIAGFLSRGGFTESATVLCQEHGIGTATDFEFTEPKW